MTHPSDAIRWLHSICVTSLKWPCEISVQTQYQAKFEQDDLHLARYPDILITLRTEGSTEIVFIESKIGSDLSGANQLAEYSAILSKMSADRKTLLFVTRDYNKQELPSVHGLIPAGIPAPRFEQTRWLLFARFLESVEPDSTVNEIRAYMKEHALDRPDVFTPFELASLAALPRALSVMRAVLDDELRDEFEAMCGIKTSPYDDAVHVVRSDTFAIQTPAAKSLPIGVTVGFWFGSAEGEFPLVFAQLFHQKAVPEKARIVEAMLRFARENPEWSAQDVGELSAWGRVFCQTSLAALIGGDSHVNAIKDYLRARMAEMKRFASAVPELNWPS